MLASRVLDLLRQQGKTLTTAESCTGGLIASMLTRIPAHRLVFMADLSPTPTTSRSQCWGWRQAYSLNTGR